MTDCSLSKKGTDECMPSRWIAPEKAKLTINTDVVEIDEALSLCDK